MHIGVFMFVKMVQPLQHLPRLLRRSGVIEISQRLAVGTLGEDWKIRANGVNIEELRGGNDLVHAAVLCASHM